MTTTTYTVDNGKVVETTTTTIEHDQATLLNSLEAQKNNILEGRANYNVDVDARVAVLQNKIDMINSL